jgi:hypothetical protein
VGIIVQDIFHRAYFISNHYATDAVEIVTDWKRVNLNKNLRFPQLKTRRKIQYKLGQV